MASAPCLHIGGLCVHTRTRSKGAVLSEAKHCAAAGVPRGSALGSDGAVRASRGLRVSVRFQLGSHEEGTYGPTKGELPVGKRTARACAREKVWAVAQNLRFS